jgi:GNAT superfamily N-acetyltransferase
MEYTRLMENLTLDLNLARRMECAEAEAAVQCAEKMRELQGENCAAVERVAGGVAVYCGPNSPITQAVALGLDGPVSAEEFDRLEAFYFSRKETVRVETCPMADATLLVHFGQRGYRVTEFSNVMARTLAAGEPRPGPTGIEIRKATPQELDLWTLTVAQGFAELFPVTDELLSVIKMFSMGKNTECYLARIGGQVAGGGILAIRGTIAGLFGASTLPEFRNRGVQTALLQTRVKDASEAGCNLAMSLTAVGSTSQRNILKQGFRVMYTRVKFERAAPAQI